MIHQTYVTARDQRSGDAFLRFGTVDPTQSPNGYSALALGIELFGDLPLTGIRTQLIMTPAEAIRLSDELRRLASDVLSKTRP